MNSSYRDAGQLSQIARESTWYGIRWIVQSPVQVTKYSVEKWLLNFYQKPTTILTPNFPKSNKGSKGEGRVGRCWGKGWVTKENISRGCQFYSSWRPKLAWMLSDCSRLEKTLNSSLPFGQVALKFFLPWESLGLLFGQARMKSDQLPDRKIYLSQTTRRHFFWALIVVLHLKPMRHH